MGFSETLVKVIFWPRVRKAKRIGEAAELIGQGRAEETLEILSRMERRIPPYVGFLFFLTRGRALDALERWEEAEHAYTAAVFAKQGASVAYVHLAVLCGRQRRFDETRDWIRRIREDGEADEELLEQADTLEAMLEDVRSGRRREELRERAAAFSNARGLSDLSIDEAATTLDEWIDAHRDEALELCDEMSCFLGERVAEERGGEWLVSLSLEDSVVGLAGDDACFEPFRVVRERLESSRPLVESL